MYPKGTGAAEMKDGKKRVGMVVCCEYYITLSKEVAGKFLSQGRKW
jgi:hypothetical protein